jgi:tetratricopeptide (TPR) repeat protein
MARSSAATAAIRLLTALISALLFNACAVADESTPATGARADSLVERAYTAFESGTRGGADTAFQFFLEAAVLYERSNAPASAAEALSNAGYVRWRSLGAPDSAAVLYRRALELARGAGDRKGEGNAILAIAQIEAESGVVADAVPRFRDALAILREAGDAEGEGIAAHNLGTVLKDLGQPDSASRYLQRAIELRRALHDTAGLAVTLGGIASLNWVLGRPDSSLSYLRQVLQLRRAAKLPGIGVTLNNIGYSFELLGEPDSAIAYYRSAIGTLTADGQIQITGITLANLGRAQLALGQPDSALTAARQGLDVARRHTYTVGESWALIAMARAHEQLGQADSAEFYYHAGLGVLRTLGDRTREGLALFQLARHLHRGRAAPEWRRVLAYYDSAAAVRAEVGSRAGSDTRQLSFAEQDVDLMEEWVLAWSAAAGEPESRTAAYGALAAAERGRAQALLDLLRGTSGEVRPGDDFVAEGRALASAVARPNITVINYVLTRDTLVTLAISGRGDVRLFRKVAPRDSVVALVARMRGDIDQLESGRAPWRALDDGPSPYVRGLGGGQPSDGSAAAAGLSSLLIPQDVANMLGDGSELVIIPHGPLALVPFVALPVGSAGQLLGDRFAVRYAPSLASLREVEQRPRQVDAGRSAGALVVGNPVTGKIPDASGRLVDLSALAGAEQEARTIAEKLRARSILGERATESAVRRRLDGAPVVHLATHGFAYSTADRARDSFLALAPDGDSDGMLTVGEILDELPSLAAELVVLSACQTGLGQLSRAEGTVGLQRAFLAKGARSVLVSLWNVSDEATRALMTNFYMHWLSGSSKAEALRRAQAEVRRTPGFEHPRYWAAFQLVGAG